MVFSKLVIWFFYHFIDFNYWLITNSLFLYYHFIKLSVFITSAVVVELSFFLFTNGFVILAAHDETKVRVSESQ